MIYGGNKLYENIYIYISKPKSHKVNEQVIAGVKHCYGDIEIVKTIRDADMVVFQKGWTRSKACVAEYREVGRLQIKREEDYIFLDKYKVHTN